jgi:DNA-binding transcriptional ArsR family regulator
MKEIMEYLEKLKYGNLTAEQEKEINNDSSVFKKYTEYFINEPYPDVNKTMVEISDLEKLIKSKTESENWEDVKQLIIHVDKSSIDVLEMYVNELGIEFKREYLQKISNKLRPFILSLKKHYNRPRPYQVSYYTNQPLFPLESKTAHTPAYPSGHALQGYFLCKVIAFHNPEKEKELMEVAETIAKTREVLGVHYKSDNLFSKYIVDELVKIKEIKDIYFNPKKLG